MIEIGKKAKEASVSLALADTEKKNRALLLAADTLEQETEYLLRENAEDVRTASSTLSSAFIDRLTLTPARIRSMADGLRQVASLPDPVGRVLRDTTRADGLRIVKKAVPLGVIGVIFEARPNVSADSAALCIKSGNAVILRGGKEAIRSNTAAVSILRSALSKAGLPEDCVQLIQDTTRKSASDLMHLDGYIDVLIPRGGPGLINAVKKEATVPVIETGAGTCHTYIAPSADPDMAVKIVHNAKTSRPSVCNALECLLVHRDIACSILPLIEEKLTPEGVIFRADTEAAAILKKAEPAEESDWGKEYDDLILAVKVVSSLDEAIGHIGRFGTHHSDAIITEVPEEAERFMNEVDSAAVYWNASTRFTDGGEFGMGAEIGISTQKLHARGPLGLEQLCSEKYYIYGKGNIR